MATLDVDIAIVGAGFAGLYALHSMRKLGVSARIFEAGDGIGGTWYWNRYPGARCDVESLEYSYQFSQELQQEWEWTERYAAQDELLRYLNHVADRFSLRRDIQLRTRIASAHFEETSARWVLRTDGGDSVTSKWVIMATGCLSKPNDPRLPGTDDFRGNRYHTARWPHEPVSFSGRRVGVIGTGSSGIQCIPEIAKQAEEVVVFQRTAAYSVPAHNHALDSETQRRVKADYPAFRARCSAQLAAINTNASTVLALSVSPAERRRVYDERWAHGGLPFTGAFADLRSSPEANETAAEYVRGKIREIVTDPETAQRLSPQNTFACKRLSVDSGYFQTFNRPNVTLVDLAIERFVGITSGGVATARHNYDLDALVLATGFDAMTGALLAMDIRGRGGLRLRDAWLAGPKTYLGLFVSGFPNIFLISGPGSPSVLSNMIVSIEQHVNFVTACIGQMESRSIRTLETTAELQAAWVDHVNQLSNDTLFPTCSSWYLGANIPGKPRVFMPYVGGFPTYVEKCQQVLASDFNDFLTG